MSMMVLHFTTTTIKKRSKYHIMFEDLRIANDHPSPPNGVLQFKLDSDNRPDSMVISYSYDYLPD